MLSGGGDKVRNLSQRTGARYTFPLFIRFLIKYYACFRVRSFKVHVDLTCFLFVDSGFPGPARLLHVQKWGLSGWLQSQQRCLLECRWRQTKIPFSQNYRMGKRLLPRRRNKLLGNVILRYQPFIFHHHIYCAFIYVIIFQVSPFLICYFIIIPHSVIFCF